MKGRIIEIFTSIQGEGLWVGRPQVFVRFHGCRLKCTYCDTPKTHLLIHQARIETKPFTGVFENHPLEISEADLSRKILATGVNSVAITGGEPLEQVDFLKSWLSQMPPEVDFLLETNGVETGALEKIISFVDLVSMDVKLPSSSGEKAYWREHEDFLKVATQKACSVKVVFDERITLDEKKNIVALMKPYSALPLILQPVSPLKKRDMGFCLEVLSEMEQQFPQRVRLIPQVHKFLGLN